MLGSCRLFITFLLEFCIFVIFINLYEMYVFTCMYCFYRCIYNSPPNFHFVAFNAFNAFRARLHIVYIGALCYSLLGMTIG